jgi:hypothetical protein
MFVTILDHLSVNSAETRLKRKYFSKKSSCIIPITTTSPTKSEKVFLGCWQFGRHTNLNLSNMSGFGEEGENTTAKEYQSDVSNSHLFYKSI